MNVVAALEKLGNSLALKEIHSKNKEAEGDEYKLYSYYIPTVHRKKARSQMALQYTAESQNVDTPKSGHTLHNQDTPACPSVVQKCIIPSLKSGHLKIKDTFSIGSKGVRI